MQRQMVTWWVRVQALTLPIQHRVHTLIMLRVRWLQTAAHRLITLLSQNQPWMRSPTRPIVKVPQADQLALAPKRPAQPALVGQALPMWALPLAELLI